MLKLNNKGFTLAETLVTVVFVMVIFSTIYTNYVPLMAEYERRETYDDIDGIYTAYWVKKLVESDDFKVDNCNSYTKIICDDHFVRYKSLCKELFKASGIENAYYAPYAIDANDSDIPPNIQEYINYLPNTPAVSNKCRVYVEMKREVNSDVETSSGDYGASSDTYGADPEDITYYAYSNIEVKN